MATRDGLLGEDRSRRLMKEGDEVNASLLIAAISTQGLAITTYRPRRMG